MISGLRLKEALIFQKSHIEKTLWNTASKMIRLERSLNALRVDEIISWHMACEGKLNDARGSIQRVGEMIDAKMSRADEAITSIKECETRLGELRSARKAAEARASEMKEQLNSKTRANLEKLKKAPKVVELKATLKALDAQLKQASADYANAKEAHPAIMTQFDQDRAFQYLFRRSYGTANYQANPVVAKLDSWLADKIDFMCAASIYQSAVTVEKRMDDFLKAYQNKKEELQNQLTMAEQEIHQELDDDRFEFSDVVNSIQDIDKKAKTTHQKMEVAKDIVKALIRGGDADFQATNEQLIKMLAREKAAAAVRLSKNHSPEVMIERNKAISLGNDRLELSVEADAIRRQACAQADRVMVIDELLRRLTARQWLTEETYFDLDERSKFFIETTFGEASVENAWPLLQQAYLPADAVFAIQEKEMALSA